MIHNGPNIKSNKSPLAYHNCCKIILLSIDKQKVQVQAGKWKRDLIESLFELGLSISYDCIMEISTAMNNYVCEQYSSEKVVCIRNLHIGFLSQQQ